jgi:hypothetical protein
MTQIASLLIVLAASVASAAIAQQPPPPSDQAPIVVTGDKTSKEAVRNFVRDLTPVGAGGQLSRFEDKVCPIVFGLAPTQNAAVEDRIRQVAKTAGIYVTAAKCSPNVVLIVASDKRAVLEDLRRHHADYFGDLSGNQIRAVIRNPAPVDAWQIQGVPLSQDGRELHQNAQGVVENYTTARASRIGTTARPQFEAAVVVVAFDALDGLSVNQLADYVALRALTGADPAKLRKAAPPTILRVFDAPFGSEVPITLTAWDLSFLRNYYDARRNLTAAAQRSAIAKAMTDDRQGPEGQ